MRSPWLRRSGAVIGAALFIGIVTVSTEQARPASTPLGRAIGVEPVEARLAVIADTIAVAQRRPSATDLAYANRMAEHQPLSALPYYIAAATRAPGDASRARQLNALALRRDPRLRPSWAWQVTDRAKANDSALATAALIRLAVLTPDPWPIWAAVAKLSVDPAARKEIKRELARGAAWRDNYLKALSESDVDRAVAFEMLQSAGKYAPATNKPPLAGKPDDRRGFLRQLISQRDYERAYLAWVQWLPAASQDAVGRVFDPSFKGYAALPPFAWELSDGVGGTTAIDPAVGLSLDYSGDDGAVLAKQMVLLPQGRFRLVTQAKFEPLANENGLAPLIWTVSCAADAKPLNELAVPLDGNARRVAGPTFDVPAGCPAQILALKVNSADFAKRLSGAIRSVSVEAVK